MLNISNLVYNQFYNSIIEDIRTCDIADRTTCYYIDFVQVCHSITFVEVTIIFD